MITHNYGNTTFDHNGDFSGTMLVFTNEGQPGDGYQVRFSHLASVALNSGTADPGDLASFVSIDLEAFKMPVGDLRAFIGGRVLRARIRELEDSSLEDLFESGRTREILGWSSEPA